MEKYFAVFKISWEQGLIYRLNFFLWRVRSVLQLLLVYFIWWTVFQTQENVFNYTQSSILTYIMVASLIRAIILSSRVMDLANQINDGMIVNFLVKPLGVIKYFFVRDLSDKLLNIFFVILEINLLIWFLQPNLNFQMNPQTVFLFVLATFLGLFLNFAIAFNVSLLAFWVENAWGPMFLLMIILEGFGGGLFPIDILPQALYFGLMLTPFPYLIYFPSKIYLGNLNPDQLVLGFAILIFWIIISWSIMIKVLSMGLRKYSAYGN